MVIFLTGSTHVGKTWFAQKLMERYQFPYVSQDHVKMGLIRSGYTNLTPYDDDKLTDYLWPVTREMAKTAIENHQNLILEGCYFPFDWKKDFTDEYLSEIRFLCLCMSEEYIEKNFEKTKEYASCIEKRMEEGDYSKEMLFGENIRYRKGCEAYNLPYTLITNDYEKTIKRELLLAFVPEEIRSYLGNQEFVRNQVGMSESDVLMFEHDVLKIQKKSVETENEAQIVSWLAGRLPVPEIKFYCTDSERAYTLMSRQKGRMLCEEEYLTRPKQLIHYVAEGLKLLWSVPVETCPLTASRLSERLKAARYNVEHGLVDLDNVEPETFGPGGFANPMELLVWLETHQPAEELVLTHGDFCLPNVFGDENGICGFIDLGKMGPADRWQDIAIALRSLHHNFAGKYSGGKAYFAFEPSMLLEELGIEPDEEKNRYYLLLDELF